MVAILRLVDSLVNDFEIAMTLVVNGTMTEAELNIEWVHLAEDDGRLSAKEAELGKLMKLAFYEWLGDEQL